MSRGWLSFAGALNEAQVEPVRLRTSREDHAFERGLAGGECFECVPEHSRVGLDRLGHRRLLDVGGEDQVGHRVQLGENLPRTLAVQQVDVDVASPHLGLDRPVPGGGRP